MTHHFDVYKLTVTRNGQFVCSTRGRDKDYLEQLGNSLCEKYNADYFKIEYVENEDELTEQWKKGELPDGWYYINSSYYANGSLIWCEGGIFIASDNVVPTERITEVLAPVPSYEEWKAQQDYEGYLKKCISVYEKKEKQHTDDAIAYNELKKEYYKQKIFDVNNKEDMDLLWSILPESIVQIKDGTTDEGGILNLFYSPDYCKGGCGFININWHDKTEITRPVNYEDMIGCVGWFGSKKIKTTLSILKSVDCTYGNPCFECKDGKHWDDFTPAKKSELKFYGD